MNITPQQWNEPIVRNGGSFLQSWEWGALQESAGHATWRLQGKGWQALVLRHRLFSGLSYFYCPGGPVVERGEAGIGNQEVLNEFAEEVGRIATKENCVFLKVE